MPRVRHVTPSRQILGWAAALVFVASGVSRADAACNVTACDATSILSDTACCGPSSCDINGTLTVSGATCTFDFDGRNLVVSGQVAAQGKTITLKARSLRLTGSCRNGGCIDVSGPSGAAAGNVTIVTTGMTALAYSQEGGTSAVVNASSTAGAGGKVLIQADGPVAFTRGSVTADGGPAAPGGVIDVSTSAGDVSVLIPLSALQGTLPPPGQRGGEITIAGPGDLTIGGSGRLTADRGSIAVNMAGAVSLLDGSVVQSNLGGDVTMVAASLQGFGEFRADGDFGGVDLTTTAGPMQLQRLSQGITVGPGGSVTLTTESRVPDGTLTMDSPILANGATVDIAAAGSLTISKKIETTGILDSGGGEVSVTSDGDVLVTKAIVGSDVYGAEDIGIDAAGNVTIAGNLETKGGLDTDGGTITVTAGGHLVVQGDVAINVSGADTSSGGTIDLEAGRDLTVASTVELIADGSPQGSAGSLILEAGVDEFGAPRLPGNVILEGDIKANGHSLSSGGQVLIEGCNVSIPSGAVVDITGDAGSQNLVTARTSLAIGGQLRASAANVLTFPNTWTLPPTGTFAPAASTDVRAPCTADNVPAGCLIPCPQCGDNQVQFPETCEIGPPGVALCAGTDHMDHCDVRCRQRHCADSNPCTDETCDPATGCAVASKANGVACNDGTVCNGLEACQNGVCVATPGSVPNCDSDQNPCTTDGGCDPVSGCFHTPLNGAGIAGCDDGAFCTGAETCVAGVCQPGTLPCQAPRVCNPATQQCEDASTCQSPADCNDGNPCTDDVCDGNCSNPPKPNGANCDDGDLCNGVRTCAGGVCQPATPVTCNDNDVCTTDACNPQNGQCQTTPVPGCCNSAAQCNDGDACTVDACTQNTCTHTALSCTDNDVCTSDSCNPQSGCQHDPDPTCVSCVNVGTCPDDADPCTDKACIANRCTQLASPNCCNVDADCTDIDRNPCTNSLPCDVGTHRCAAPQPLTGPACGTRCNPATCQSGTCVADPAPSPDLPPSCDDNNPCTTDLCTDDQGCTHPPIAQCCQSTTECNDGDACTADACDLDRNGCVHPVPDPTCTPCSGTDPFECGPRCANACVAGRCVDLVADCDDDNPCTTDACDATAGCTNTPHDGTGVSGCDDGQACNGAERCISGACQTQPVLECDDDDICTDDTCADASGCVNTGKTGFEAISCRLQDLQARLAAPDDGSSARVRARLQRRVEKLAGKIASAQSAVSSARGSATSTQAGVASKCPKAKRLLVATAKQLRSLERTAIRLAGHQLSPTLATVVAGRAGEAATKCDEAKLGLGC